MIMNHNTMGTHIYIFFTSHSHRHRPIMHNKYKYSSFVLVFYHQNCRSLYHWNFIYVHANYYYFIIITSSSSIIIKYLIIN